jgi:membrane-associated protease RseP (regulator of RpoE activity)
LHEKFDMKTNKQMTSRPNRSVIIAVGVLLAGLFLGTAIAGDEERKIVVTAGAGAEEGDQAARPQAARKEIIIRATEPESKQQAAKELTWLGVSVEEVSEALADQLGLKYGEGLVVNHVSTDSPAAKVELRKNDVLVKFGGQILVDPSQLRKLVQMHPDGDSVKVTFYLGGKKQSVMAKLGKKTWNETSLNVDEGSLQDACGNYNFSCTD